MRPQASAPDAVAPPPGNPRFEHLDGIRGLALLTVIAYHAALVVEFTTSSHPLAFLLADLRFGPPVFFVLSAFLLYRPFVAARVSDAPPVSVRAFARRRALRIVPAYYVALLLVGGIGFLERANPEHASILTDEAWRYFGFAQAYDTDTWQTGLAHAWSIDVEVAFYLLLPLLAIAGSALSARLGTAHLEIALLVVLVAISGAVRTWLFLEQERLTEHFWLVVNLPTNFAYFAAGMVMALISARLPGTNRLRSGAEALARRPGVCWLLAGVLFVLSARLRSKLPLIGLTEYLTFLAIAVLVVLPAAFPKDERHPVLRLLSAPPLAWLGLISYGTYIWHGPMLSVAFGFDHDPEAFTRNVPVLFTITLAMSIACGAASYYVVERPLLRFKHRRRSVRMRRSAAHARKGHDVQD